jgi:hypothetical protein
VTLEKAHELTALLTDPGSGCNRNAARMVPGEVMPENGQAYIL